MKHSYWSIYAVAFGGVEIHLADCVADAVAPATSRTNHALIVRSSLYLIGQAR